MNDKGMKNYLIGLAMLWLTLFIYALVFLTSCEKKKECKSSHMERVFILVDAKNIASPLNYQWIEVCDTLKEKK